MKRKKSNNIQKAVSFITMEAELLHNEGWHDDFVTCLYHVNGEVRMKIMDLMHFYRSKDKQEKSE